MGTIALTSGKTAAVDDSDFDMLSGFRWHDHRIGHCWYARRKYRDEHGKMRSVFMHSQIMAAPKGIGVDHRNGDGLDNRRANLRFANASQNQQNRHRLTTNTSGYRGVFWDRGCGKWKAAIKHLGKNYHIGRYATAEEAAHAYDAKACVLFGEFARLNFPQGGGA